jgi:hypothetical protein
MAQSTSLPGISGMAISAVWNHGVNGLLTWRTGSYEQS